MELGAMAEVNHRAEADFLTDMIYQYLSDANHYNDRLYFRMARRTADDVMAHLMADATQDTEPVDTELINNILHDIRQQERQFLSGI